MTAPLATGNQPENRHQHIVRVISVFATPWQYPSYDHERREPDFEMGGLKPFYPLFRDQLPKVVSERVLHHGEAQPSDVLIAQALVTAAKLRLFALPSDQVVAALTLDFRGPDVSDDPSITIAVLEQCAYAEHSVGGIPLRQHLTEMAQAAGIDANDVEEAGVLPPERHQIVFVHNHEHQHEHEHEPASPGGHRLPEKDDVDRILFRIAPPYRREYLSIIHPKGLNQQRNRTFGAVTPYVSLIYGHEEFIEDTIFLTVVQAVGTAARFRQIWRDAYHRVRTFRAKTQSAEVGKQRRADLEDLVDRLGNLELDLSFSVETSADLGLLIPSLRIESFHSALYRVMELPARAKTVSRMFARLDSSIRAELTAIDIRERQDEERKRLRRASAVSVLGVIVAPLGFLMAFFGINAAEVSDEYSVFDLHRYWPAYAVAGAIAAMPVLAFGFLFGWSRLRDRMRARGEVLLW